jgi:ketosteroid isomerase-like protein
MKYLAFAMLVVLAAPQLHAQGAASTADAVRAADVAFEKRAQDVGAAEAFREYMDETDGLQFNGSTPTRGATAIFQAMGGNAPAKTRLEWTPVDAWGSNGGDMGVTTGTWQLSLIGGSKPMITGRYVTVWRKNAMGQWKGLIDIGNPDSK